MKRLGVLALVVLLVASLPARAHENDDDSVEIVNGRPTVVFEDHTAHGYWRYRQYAVRQWRELNDPETAEGVRIRNAKNTELQTTLAFYTYCSYDGHNGWYFASYSPDRIYLNRCELSDNGRADRRRVAMHVIGHALRLDHPPEEYRKTSIMYTPSVHTNLSKPGSHDRIDYREMWGK